jgi:hypothetical protein
MIRRVAWTILLALTAYPSKPASAMDLKPWELREASIEWKHFVSPGRDPLLFPEIHKDGLNLNVDIDVLKWAYWNNTVGSLSTASQYRAIWLHTELGVRLSSYVDFEFSHTSTHLLDREQSLLPRYPVEDSVVLKLYLIRPSQSAPTLLP